MTVSEEYRAIFDKEILQKCKGVIFSYSPLDDKYQFQPFSHGTGATAVEDLGQVMRHNLLFYAFGEDEVVDHYNKGHFSSLEYAAQFAYRQRLPKRADANDGLPSEVLLDLLVQICQPNAYKLAVRTLFRQDDNNEIRGYDLTYFVKEGQEITLWLGQAKLGQKNYCKTSIDDDLTKKYTENYLAKQMFFISDKRVSITKDARDILDLIEELNIQMLTGNEEARAKGLMALFQKKNISIKIPCLLAYDANDMYCDASKIYQKLETEVASISNYYHKKVYSFSGFAPEIVFYIFPIKSVDRLRDKENGFYAGLCPTTADGN